MEKLDVVYICKSARRNEELRYSLRTVAENFPHARVWIYGGKPKDIRPDVYMEMAQDGKNKWARVRSSLRAICQNPDISERFWLFNDDFFILEKCEALPAWTNGTLQELIAEKEGRLGGRSAYTLQLQETVRQLARKRLPAKNYAVHVPMEIDRKKALETLAAFPDGWMFRSLYGNHHGIEAQDLADVKIATIYEPIEKGTLICSTSDEAFDRGLAGAQIRKRFDRKCRWEK